VTVLPGLSFPPEEPTYVSESPGNPRNASALPLVLVVVALLGSGAIIWLLQWLGAESWSLVGYALTPLFAVVATGWDALAQLSGRKDPWFVARPAFSRILRVLVAVSIVFGIVHIWRISDWLARTAVQEQWPFLT
jgi:hypothetical protein